MRKISPPTEFDPWTVQPVASRYTDYATPPTGDLKGEVSFWGGDSICHYEKKCYSSMYLILKGYEIELFESPDLTYVRTPWCRVLLEKLTGLQLVKKFPAFHGT